MVRSAIARGHLRALPGVGAAAGQPERLSDAALIEGIQQGDARVAGEIYARLLAVVEHTLYRILGRRTPEHRDLVQATFEQIVVTLSTGRFAGACSLETWASALATNVGLKALRSQRREAQVIERAVDFELHPGAAHADFERELDARAQLALVRRQLAAMNPGQATTVFLHDALGHNLTEIALISRVSVAAAQSRLVRGRRELWRRMEKAPRKPKKERR